MTNLLKRVSRSYVTKKQKAENLRREHLRAMINASDRERMVATFLYKHAIDVLEATGRGHTVSHLWYAEQLLEKLKEAK